MLTVFVRRRSSMFANTTVTAFSSSIRIILERKTWGKERLFKDSFRRCISDTNPDNELEVPYIRAFGVDEFEDGLYICRFRVIERDEQSFADLLSFTLFIRDAFERGFVYAT